MDSTDNNSDFEITDISQRNENNTRNNQISLEEENMIKFFNNLNLNENMSSTTRYNNFDIEDIGLGRQELFESNNSNKTDTSLNLVRQRLLNSYSNIESCSIHRQRLNLVRRKLFGSNSSIESDNFDYQQLNSVQKGLFDSYGSNETDTAGSPKLDLVGRQLFDSNSSYETTSGNNSRVNVARRLFDPFNSDELPLFVTDDYLPIARKRTNRPSASRNEACPRKKKRRQLRRSRSLDDETSSSFKLLRKHNRKLRTRQLINRKRLSYRKDLDDVA